MVGILPICVCLRRSAFGVRGTTFNGCELEKCKNFNWFLETQHQISIDINLYTKSKSIKWKKCSFRRSMAIERNFQNIYDHYIIWNSEGRLDFYFNWIGILDRDQKDDHFMRCNLFTTFTLNNYFKHMKLGIWKIANRIFLLCRSRNIVF